MVQGRFSDGRSAAAHDVTLHLRDGKLVISGLDGAALTRWPLKDVRRMRSSGAGGPIVLGLVDEDARVSFEDRDFLDLVAVYAPALKGGLQSRQRLRPVVLAALGAAVALPLIFFELVPRLAESLAAFVTPETEIAMGDRTYPQLVRAVQLGRGEPLHRCTGQEGAEVLAELTARMEGALDLPFPLRVEVWDSEIVNAFAIPGGRIVLFRGLLDAADGPDGVAGVLAHEIGHVANRDSVRLGLRAAGSAGLIGLVIGDFAGGAITLALAEAAMSASYTREAEGMADDFALDQLAALDIPAEGLAAFFESLGAEGDDDDGHRHDGPDLLSHLATHPDLRERAAKARSRSTGTQAALSTEEWSALRAICAEGEPILQDGDVIERLERMRDQLTDEDDDS